MQLPDEAKPDRKVFTVPAWLVPQVEDSDEVNVEIQCKVVEIPCLKAKVQIPFLTNPKALAKGVLLKRAKLSAEELEPPHKRSKTS